MKKHIQLAGAVAACTFALSAQAQVGVSASAGTTGLGVHVSVPVRSDLNARFGINVLNYSHDGSTSNVDYDFKLKMQNVDALVDYFPISNGFRVTGGVVYNGNKIEARGRPNAAGTFTLNGTTYSAATVGMLNGNIEFRKLAPYLGIGWGNAVAKDSGWGFSADVGVLFQGAPRTSLSNSGCTGTAAVCAQLASDIAAENRALREEVKDFKAFPVVRVGLHYKF